MLQSSCPRMTTLLAPWPRPQAINRAGCNFSGKQEPAVQKTHTGGYITGVRFPFQEGLDLKCSNYSNF